MQVRTFHAELGVMPKAKEALRVPFETLAKASGQPAWLIAAVRVGHRLPVGFEMTQADFDGLLEKTRNFSFR